MAVRPARVEIEFVAGTWTDVSAWAYHREVSIQSGRDSEVGDSVPVGTCAVTLNNDDGRFSPDLPASPYYPNVVEGRRIRVSVWVSGSWRVRHLGTIQSWAVSWIDDTTLHSVAAITSSDMLGSLPDYTFRAASDEVIRSTANVLYHWPLREQPAAALIGTVTGTDNGGSGWGEGSALALDDGDEKAPKFTAAPGGLTIGMQPLVMPTPWRLRFVLHGPPTASCTLMRWYSPSVGSTWANLPWVAGSGLRWGGGYLMPSEWPVVIEAGYSNPGSMTLRCCDAAGSVSTVSVSPGFTYRALTKLELNPALSGGAAWSMGHLVILSGAPSVPALQAYATALLGSRRPANAPAMVLSTAGGPAITGVPASTIVLPPLSGRDAADVLGSMAKGMGARLIDNRDGTLGWVPFGAQPAPIALPAGEVDQSMVWQTDATSWLSDVSVTWPDDSHYNASRPDGRRKADSIEPVHATRNGDRGYADWLVWSGSLGARIPLAAYDLATLPDATAVTLAGVTVGARVSLSGLPSQMPASLVCIVEGIEESINAQEWTLTLKLSPDVVTRLFILDSATQGVLDSTYLLAP